jgi:hypothetical protein
MHMKSWTTKHLFQRIFRVGLFVFALFCGSKAAYAIPIALQPATLMDVSSGSGVGSGSVSTGHTIFQFNGFAGNAVTLAANVTAIFPGILDTDDDTVLFLFNDLGALLAFDDDSGPGRSSLITGFALPTTGSYFVGMTTDPNDPIFSLAGIITGWEDNGESNLNFNLNVSGITPTTPPGPIPVPEPSSLVLIGSGILFGIKISRKLIQIP